MANAANIREVGTDGVTIEKPIPASQPGDTFPAGAIILYAGASAPSGWAICQGGDVSRATYPSYAAQMATDSYPWGAGDGSTTVGIPDFRDFVPVGKSATKALGSSVGAETHTLTAAEMPVHSHTGPSHTHTFTPAGTVSSHSHTFSMGGNTFTWSAGSGINTGLTWGTAGGTVFGSSVAGTTSSTQPSFTGSGGTTAAGGTGATGNAGSGAAHNNMQPSKAVNYIIRLY